MLYISFAHAPGSEMYYKVIAHEMQHMVHWSTDSNETTWLDEGLAELSAHISGYTDEPFISGFAATPDTPLTNFSHEEGQFPQQYGASFCFAAYLLDRFGRDTVRAIVEHPANGTNGINAVLATVEKPTTFDEVFADWVRCQLSGWAGVGARSVSLHIGYCTVYRRGSAASAFAGE